MTAGRVTPASDAHQPVFDHLERLTDDRGLFEHALHTVPRREHGCCLVFFGPCRGVSTPPVAGKVRRIITLGHIPSSAGGGKGIAELLRRPGALAVPSGDPAAMAGGNGSEGDR